MNKLENNQVIIIGAGFTGLSAAFELCKNGVSVVVLEAESEVGGLAASFDVNGEKLDRFYHHWFTNDMEVMNLINELKLTGNVQINPTNTGIYYANNFFKLSTPFDLLNFTPLNFLDRIRLGFLALRARRIKDWKLLENKTAKEWLKELGGDNVFRIVWKPLLDGKFGPFSDQISAVWFWNKLKLRGGSRGKSGEERLAYYKGGFAALANSMMLEINSLGGVVCLNTKATRILNDKGIWTIETTKGDFKSENIIFTVPLPIISDLIKNWASPDYLEKLNRINYIGNVCLVLELDRSLSKTYWLNVNEPDFPFVGVIEHTNFEKPETYGGRHIVYLSKYLPFDDKLFSFSSDEFLDFAYPFIKKMFPLFEKTWILNHHLWRARYSQPIVEKFYSSMIPEEKGPIDGMYLCTMAQIYPEDRGTNYAIREGRLIGLKLSKKLEIIN
jgi:protoporphyrinogen oxidase